MNEWVSVSSNSKIYLLIFLIEWNILFLLFLIKIFQNSLFIDEILLKYYWLSFGFDGTTSAVYVFAYIDSGYKVI